MKKKKKKRSRISYILINKFFKPFYRKLYLNESYTVAVDESLLGAMRFHYFLVKLVVSTELEMTFIFIPWIILFTEAKEIIFFINRFHRRDARLVLKSFAHVHHNSEWKCGMIISLCNLMAWHQFPFFIQDCIHLGKLPTPNWA